MSADKHVNPNQLKMFMSAQELHDTHSIEVQQTPESRYGRPRFTMTKMWGTKRRENKVSGLDKDVAANGVHEPVELAVGQDIDGEVVLNGHHRVQAAFQGNPQSLVPVVHRTYNNYRAT